MALDGDGLYRQAMTPRAAKRTESNGNPAEKVTKQPHEQERGPASDAPRYASIKRFIHDAIESGTLKPGDRVPSEAELVTRFRVSRMTANRALRELQSAGVLVRRAGSGSFVAEAKPIGHMIEIRNIADEVRARGHAYRARVVQNEAVKAGVDTAALMGVFHSIIVHHEAEFPIQIEERIVLASVAPDYARTDFTHMTPNEYLTRIAPLERVEHRVRAAMPDDPTRSLLGLEEGEPILVMTRQTWSRGRLVSHAWLTHPASRFELSASFSVPSS
jgi:GntR family transcriptional regulator, histidine utilization repressor